MGIVYGNMSLKHFWTLYLTSKTFEKPSKTPNSRKWLQSRSWSWSRHRFIQNLQLNLFENENLFFYNSFQVSSAFLKIPISTVQTSYLICFLQSDSVRQNQFCCEEVVGNICKFNNTNSANRTEQDVNFGLNKQSI